MGHVNFDELREVKIHKVLGIRDSGQRVNVRCPFHSDRTPSLSIYPDGSYHCFGCGQHGRNSIDFLLELSGDIKEVINELEKYI